MAGGLQQSDRTSHRRGRRSFRPMSEINVTPFVDVMLVLLIIFMVAAPLLTVGVDVDLPETDASTLPGTDEPLAVSINAERVIFVQDTPVEMTELVPKLVFITENNRDVRIFLRADQTIDYGLFMKVLGTLNAAGFTRVGLVGEIPSQ